MTAGGELGGTMGGKEMLASGVAAGMGINEAVANAAMTSIQTQFTASYSAWFPGIWKNIRDMFNVGHPYVLRKVGLLMCPFVMLRRKGSEQSSVLPTIDFGASVETNKKSGRQAGPDGLKVHTEEPDLYIPLMSFVTYVLLYGIQRGIDGDFQPDVLAASASFAVFLLVAEVCIAKTSLHIAGCQAPVLDVLANAAYKYVPVMVMVFLRTLIKSPQVYYPFFAYFAACAAFSAWRFAKCFEASALLEQYGPSVSRLHKHVIIGIALAQVPLCWILT